MSEQILVLIVNLIFWPSFIYFLYKHSQRQQIETKIAQKSSANLSDESKINIDEATEHGVKLAEQDSLLSLTRRANHLQSKIENSSQRQKTEAPQLASPLESSNRRKPLKLKIVRTATFYGLSAWDYFIIVFPIICSLSAGYIIWQLIDGQTHGKGILSFLSQVIVISAALGMVIACILAIPKTKKMVDFFGFDDEEQQLKEQEALLQCSVQLDKEWQSQVSEVRDQLYGNNKHGNE